MEGAGDSQITITASPSISPEQELDALATVYRFVLFESRKSEEGGAAAAPRDDVKESHGYVARKKFNVS